MPHPLRRPAFRWLLLAQLLSALNDNFVKNAVVLWLTATRATWLGWSADALVAACTATFILPFFLWSAIAGRIADRYDKSRLIRWVKGAELLIAGVVGAGLFGGSVPTLLVGVFLMGLHSAFLGPVKYGILPALTAPDELVAANAAVEVGTFLAILLGTLAGGALVLGDSGALAVTVGAVVLAAMGLAAAIALPPVAPAAPTLEIGWNPWPPSREVLGLVRRNRALFLSALGISWFWLVGAVLLSVLPGWVRDVLRAPEAAVTPLLAIFCVGIALGSFLCERLSRGNLELGLVPVGSIGMTVALLDLGLSPTPTGGPFVDSGALFAAPGTLRISLDLLAVAVFGGLLTVPLYTLVQQRSPAAERSRIVAGNNILNAAFMVAGSGMLVALLAAGIGKGAVFVVLAALNAGVALYIYSVVPEFLLRFLAWALAHSLYRLDVRGHQHIPEEGPALVVCNHQSFVDFLVLGGSFRRPLRFVMDHRIAATPGLSLLFRHGKTIPIAPAREDKTTMDRAFERVAAELADGQLVAIFPEGGITRDGRMQAFRPGVERILAETPVPVIPVGLVGLWESMWSRKDSGPFRFPRRLRGTVELRIGPPIAAAQAGAASLRRAVAELIGEEAEEPSAAPRTAD